jgi:hypothetical protein
MKLPLLLLFLALGNLAMAQDEPDFPDMRSWMINNNDTTDRYIFADTALIRISPDTRQAPIDTLFAGDNITVTGKTPKALTIRGLKGPWLKIDYAKNGATKSGYIWQGLVSCMPLRRGEIKFVYGIERRADSFRIEDGTRYEMKRFLVRIKVIKNGQVLAKSAVATYDDEGAQFCYGRIMSGMGLTNVQNIVVLQFGGEACGIMEYEYYFALTKSNQLIHFPDKEGVGDAGVYYHTENFIFPNEKNGKPDTIFWSKLVEEATDKVDKKGNEILKVTEKKSAVYTWDGVNEKITGPLKK